MDKLKELAIKLMGVYWYEDMTDNPVGITPHAIRLAEYVNKLLNERQPINPNTGSTGTQEKGLVALNKNEMLNIIHRWSEKVLCKSTTEELNHLRDIICSTFTAKASIENVKLPEKKKTPILNSEQAMLENLEVIGWNACHDAFTRVINKEG